MRYLTLACLLIASPLSAATITGSVRSPDGKPVAGAIVTATSADGFLSESVYSDGTGAFILATQIDGHIRLRIRHPQFSDFLKELDASQGTQNISVSLKAF